MDITTKDKSHIKNVTVNGNGNQVITDSKDTKINNIKGSKTSQHWLQLLYWVVGIVLALIGIYKFYME